MRLLLPLAVTGTVAIVLPALQESDLDYGFDIPEHLEDGHYQVRYEPHDTKLTNPSFHKRDESSSLLRKRTEPTDAELQDKPEDQNAVNDIGLDIDSALSRFTELAFYGYDIEFRKPLPISEYGCTVDKSPLDNEDTLDAKRKIYSFCGEGGTVGDVRVELALTGSMYYFVCAYGTNIFTATPCPPWELWQFEKIINNTCGHDKGGYVQMKEWKKAYGRAPRTQRFRCETYMEGVKHGPRWNTNAYQKWYSPKYLPPPSDGAMRPKRITPKPKKKAA